MVTQTDGVKHVADDKCCAKEPDEGYTDRWNSARNPGVNKPAPSLEPALAAQQNAYEAVPKPVTEKDNIAAQINDRGSNLTPVGNQPTRAEMVALTGGYTEPRKKPKIKTEPRKHFEPTAYAKGGYTQRWSKARGK